jgi:hypothetical protein
MSIPHLLLHLPDRKGKGFESSPKLIEEYLALAEERDYVWLCKPGAPLDPSLRQDFELALQQDDEIYVYLFVRLSLDERQLAIYRARLLGIQGPGPNADTEHTLPRFRGCSSWLKLAGLEPTAAEQINRLYDARTGQPVPVWTDLRTDLHVVVEGDPWSLQPQEPRRSYWLLCLGQIRAKAEFDQSWRFRPIITYQPGSAEFVAEYEEDTPQRVLVYDRVFGSPTYLTILGIYEVADLVSQGTTAGALIYAVQLREAVGFLHPPQLDPRHAGELWHQLDIAQHPTDWAAMVSGDRILLSLTNKDYQYILSQVGLQVGLETLDQAPPKLIDDAAKIQGTKVEDETESSDLATSLGAFEAITAKPPHTVTEVECYHLLRALERALREFIDRELSRVSRDWWGEGRLPQENRARAEERKQKREHPFPWLSQQNLPSKEYLDFSDYAEIITMDRNWNEVFQPIFIRPEVIQGKLIEISILRNDIAHMRELPPLDKETFISVGRQLLLTIRGRLLNSK